MEKLFYGVTSVSNAHLPKTKKVICHWQVSEKSFLLWSDFVLQLIGILKWVNIQPNLITKTTASLYEQSDCSRLLQVGPVYEMCSMRGAPLSKILPTIENFNSISRGKVMMSLPLA